MSSDNVSSFGWQSKKLNHFNGQGFIHLAGCESCAMKGFVGTKAESVSDSHAGFESNAGVAGQDARQVCSRDPDFFSCLALGELAVVNQRPEPLAEPLA